MTGPIGARTNRAVALVTDDFRTYHRLVPVFEARGLPVLGLRPGDEVPVAVQALIGGPSSDPRSVGLRDDAEATLLAVLQVLDERPVAEAAYPEVVFGVDPGQTIGLAVLAAGMPLLVAEERGPKLAAERLRRWRTGLWADRVAVHIGDGEPVTGQGVAAEAARLMPGAEVAFVHEGSTTPYSPATKSRHTDAAIHIALRRPRP